MDDRDLTACDWLPAEPPTYLMCTTEPETVMVALEHLIVATGDHGERGRAMRALADLMAVSPTDSR
ncbi:hypothetical protein [Solicola sp. PLA-1-18]|uniref:hypothetical protein n=1 Tax=Solicola sp. PLA-1-18 TaxID=3380532 RepID=UPI003B7F1C08